MLLTVEAEVVFFVLTIGDGTIFAEALFVAEEGVLWAFLIVIGIQMISQSPEASEG